ncbi:23S rRNA (pseudouridine(1915)-N(3))-methyltransferase RlmH [Caldovatus sp. SYSU G05006]|uniref:Ribosomal RNA large subunit methyltransferase H n=1 Tax=Caldovatus aquaticus TaxID=2865671 RepID=A0ABS7F611_9PROT|nr:23S rRNA (pseudouridine(1915)-N(3))-methyltransferase RlmH [Caldovatus aquaticus]MBW8271050.1 23S rRNA (pseudouridine(1915)-N(3))-methyltransferase RlmH [Caldovatus aquaticus]
MLLAVGRLRGDGGPEAALFAHYNARLRPPLRLVEVAEAPAGTSPAERRRREGAALLAALPRNAFAVALDLGGEAPGSEGLAVLTARWIESGRPLAFLVGGAEGLDPAVLARADYVLSLGPFTWPHLLVRGLLAEQLYRAQAIRAGHPYHRGGRP